MISYRPNMPTMPNKPIMPIMPNKPIMPISLIMPTSPIMPIMPKKLKLMKQKLLFLILIFLPLFSMAQQYTNSYSKAEFKSATKWAKHNAPWTKNFTKGKPNLVNMVDFQKQYTKNKAQWDALFEWLQKTDLLALTEGKHDIPGTTLTASVQDDTNKPIAERSSESHRKKIDFQFVVSGTEGFVLLDHTDAATKPNCEYNDKKDVIHYDYDPSKALFNETPFPRFNIFFPGDWHVAKVLTSKKDQHFRVIVVKMDYVD